MAAEIGSILGRAGRSGSTSAFAHGTVKKSLRDVPTMFSSVQKENNNNNTSAPNKNTIESHAAFEEYLNSKFHQLEISINSSVENIKRSLLYDIEIKTTAIKNAIIANATDGRASNIVNCSEARAGVGVTLPIRNLDDFLELDAVLKNDAEKRKALMTLYRVLVCGESQAKDCVSKIMVATITKSVEMSYSGTGRIVKNVGKKNFSATATDGCLKDTLLEKFGDCSHEIKNLFHSFQKSKKVIRDFVQIKLVLHFRSTILDPPFCI